MSSPRLLSLLALLFALVTPGCPAGPGAAVPKRSLPSYDRRATELFDDIIEPRAAGISLDEPNSPSADTLLRARTQVGDAVVRVVVTTATAKQEDTGTTYQLGLRPIDRLAGNHAPDAEFSVRIDRNSPSAGIMKTIMDQIVGKKFIAFVATFARPDGDEEMHFHLAPNDGDVEKAVKQAALLQELK